MKIPVNACLAVALLAACTPRPAPEDAGNTADASLDDGGSTDAAVPLPDAGTPDAGEPDAAGALQPNERTTDLGVVRGENIGNADVFRGIPYAAPPVGPLRFKPPQAATPWTGVRDATAYGPQCAQFDLGVPAGSEDCLTLNIWQPTAASAQPRPVLVWIHGGDNMGGSAVEPGFRGGLLYDGHAFAEQDLVFVSIQYRVGALGFLQHPAFAADNTRGAKGNWGLQDQIAALEWIQRNIASFGGDPTRITAAGQSAGADNICALMASPRAAGLFHAGVLMSPGGCHNNSDAVATQTAKATLTAVGCPDDATVPECLRSVPVNALIAAPQSGAPAREDRVDFYIGVDGWVLTQSPRAVLRAGTHAHLPLVVGSTSDEMFAAFLPVLPANLTAADYTTWMVTLFGDTLAPQVEAQYNPADYGGSRFVGLVAAQGDAVHHCTIRSLAQVASATQPVFRYVYQHTYSDPQMATGHSSHGFELPLLFDNTTGIATTAAETALGTTFRMALAQFAHNHDPNVEVARPWPTFTAAGDQAALVSTQWSNVAAYRDAACDFWDARRPW